MFCRVDLHADADYFQRKITITIKSADYYNEKRQKKKLGSGAK